MKKDPDSRLWLSDSRRGVFHVGDTLYSAKLVDLPCIVESQKTLDNKNVFKVADICQVKRLPDQYALFFLQRSVLFRCL